MIYWIASRIAMASAVYGSNQSFIL
jgi:hypothetical protein